MQFLESIHPSVLPASQPPNVPSPPVQSLSITSGDGSVGSRNATTNAQQQLGLILQAMSQPQQPTVAPSQTPPPQTTLTDTGRNVGQASSTTPPCLSNTAQGTLHAFSHHNASNGQSLDVLRQVLPISAGQPQTTLQLLANSLTARQGSWNPTDLQLLRVVLQALQQQQQQQEPDES